MIKTTTINNSPINNFVFVVLFAYFLLKFNKFSRDTTTHTTLIILLGSDSHRTLKLCCLSLLSSSSFISYFSLECFLNHFPALYDHVNACTILEYDDRSLTFIKREKERLLFTSYLQYTRLVELL